MIVFSVPMLSLVFAAEWGHGQEVSDAQSVSDGHRAGVADSDGRGIYQVMAVKPSNPIVHGLEVKSGLDEKRRWVTLRGPAFYSSPQAGNELNPAYLNWYAIRKPAEEPAKKVRLSGGFSGGKAIEARLGKPLFYLIPAQTITDGPPSEIPEDLNHFLVFEILGGESLELAEPVLGKPAMVAIPAEEWHHADHTPIKTAKSWLMIFEPSDKSSGSQSKKVTTIDHFGLNGLQALSTDWIYTPARPQ